MLQAHGLFTIFYSHSGHFPVASLKPVSGTCKMKLTDPLLGVAEAWIDPGGCRMFAVFH